MTHLEVILPPETPSSSRALLSSATASPNPQNFSYPIHTDTLLSRLGDEFITSCLLGTAYFHYDRIFIYHPLTN